LPNRCLATAVSSGSTIPSFSRYIIAPSTRLLINVRGRNVGFMKYAVEMVSDAWYTYTHTHRQQVYLISLLFIFSKQGK
jgi:hypothetical protein